MKKTVGLWIDHRKAVIVFVAGKTEEVKLISSKEENHHGHSGMSKPSDDIRQRELTGHLNSYYDEVISCIRDGESILIFGPGEAKGELQKRLEKDNLGGRIVGIFHAQDLNAGYIECAAGDAGRQVFAPVESSTENQC